MPKRPDADFNFAHIRTANRTQNVVSPCRTRRSARPTFGASIHPIAYMVVRLHRRQLLLPLAYTALNTFFAQNSRADTVITAAATSRKVIAVTDPAYGQWGTWNLTDGAQGPYWVNLDVWNDVTKRYTCNYTAGSTTVTGLASTTGISVGMVCFSYPQATSNSPWPTVVSVAANSIVLSSPATVNSTGNQAQFALRKGTDYNESITVDPATFPNGTILAWSFPAYFNDSNVYSFPNLTYGSTGYYHPANTPAPMRLGSFKNLSVTYNVTASFGTNDADCMFECWSSSATPISPTNTTNEISFFCHAPDYMVGYILSLASHFNYSAGGFNAYIALKPSSPPQMCIMPVTVAGGTTPLDMMSGTQTIPVLAILRALVAQGWLSNTDYISGMQFGIEPGRNSGSLTFNSITWTWN